MYVVCMEYDSYEKQEYKGDGLGRTRQVPVYQIGSGRSGLPRHGGLELELEMQDFRLR